MPYLGYALFGDRLKAFDTVPQDDLFLLDGSGTILAARTADGDRSLVGSSFFRTFRVLREEEETLRTLLRSYGNISLLFRAGDLPAVAWCNFFHRSGLFAVWMPRGEVAQCLARPSAYAEIFSDLFGIYLSKGALAAYAPQDELLYLPAAKWLQSLYIPVFYHHSLQNAEFGRGNKFWVTAEYLLHTLAHRIRTLAELVGIDLEYDWNGLGYGDTANPDLESITATLCAIFLAVHRAAKNGSCKLWMTREGVEGPVIEGCFVLKDPADPLPELQTVERRSALHGEGFLSYRHPQEPDRFLFKLPICRREFSVQDLKRFSNQPPPPTWMG